MLLVVMVVIMMMVVEVVTFEDGVVEGKEEE